MATTNLTLTNLAYVSEDYPSTHYTVNSSTWYYIGERWSKKNYMFTKLEAFPAAYKHNQLLGIQFRVRIRNDGAYQHFEVYRSEDYDAATITWYTMPRREMDFVVFMDVFYTGTGDRTLPDTLNGTNDEKRQAYRTLNCEALCVAPPVYSDFEIKTTLSDSTPIYAIVSYDDAVIVTSEIAYRSGPQSGYANPRNAITFSWDYDATDYCADPTWGQASATFYWKKSTDANYTAVSAGTAKSVTIAANTFPTAETISWYVVGTDDEGTTSQTAVYTFSTAASASTATPMSPINTVEDGSAPITFQWQITSDDGQPASRTRIWWKLPSEDENSWRVLVDENDSITSYTVPGGTLSAGEVQWKAQTFNVDGVEGAWSDVVSFICVSAPNPVAGLSATNVPYSTITWQSGDQQAYQIIVDGEVVKKAFGANVYSHTLEEPLTDGTHEISVIVQGLYGYWSQPSTVTVVIQNVPDDTITLTGTFAIDATLQWDTDNPVFVYRDGVKIAKASAGSFVDRLTLGSHDYYVIEPLANGNYNISNSVGGSISVDCCYIAPLTGGDWLKLEYSKLNPVQTYTKSRTVSVKHYCGSKYPVVEMSNFYDHSGNYNVLFTDKQNAEAFKSLLGEMVVVKSRQDIVIVGVFSQFDERVEDFYFDYDFIIQESDGLEDFINESND